MTTAHKPTFHPAVGSQHLGGFRFAAPRVQVSVRDLNSYTTLKFRCVRARAEFLSGEAVCLLYSNEGR
jgi:protein CWC15